MKILVTGAHFTPAVATIEQLRKMGDIRIVYVGRNTTLEGDRARSVESKLFPLMGIKFISITAGRLQRSLTVFTLLSLLKIPIGFFQALLILFKERPDVILSFGGYVGLPVVIIGWFFSIPVIIHEQALIPGLANKISSVFADKIAVSFSNGAFTGKKVVLTGNPLRKEIIEKSLDANINHLAPPAKPLATRGQGGRKPATVLVMGGNQGSHIINLTVEKCLVQLLKMAVVFHQTGDSKYRDFDRLEKLEGLGSLGEKYMVKKWIGEEYAKILQKADLVISRAGINTLTELAFFGKPTLLIPIPNSEQNENAKFFEDLGMARILPQSKLSPWALLENVSFMLKRLDSLKKKAGETKKVVIPDAAKRLALETVLLGIMETCGEKKPEDIRPPA